MATKQPANYPLNCWWVAATTDELGDQPLGLMITGKPIVLYRTADGQVAALDNRCPHRWAPLSLGKIEGDSIRCPYHGFRFAVDGQCDDLPSQKQIPRSCRVAAYPILERDGLIWIWPGDPDLAAQNPMKLDTSWLTAQGWSVINGRVEIAANYQLLKENVLDLTHIPHIHSDTIGLDDWKVPPKVTEEGDVVTYCQDFEASPLPEQQRMVLKSGDLLGAQRYMGRAYSPAAHHSTLDITLEGAAPGQRSEFQLSIYHLATPETPTRMVYRYFFGWNIEMPDVAKAKMAEAVKVTFLQDKDILEATQALIASDPRGLDHPEILVRADEAAIRARRVLQRMLAREASAKDQSLQQGLEIGFTPTA